MKTDTTTKTETSTKTKAPEQARLSCRGLEVGHGARALLPALDVEVRAGEVWALVGRNGCGKTTLLKTLLGELRPVAGAYEIHSGSRLAHVAQRGSHDLCVPARASDMVEAGIDRGWGFWRWGGRAEGVRQALKNVGAEELANEPYGHLSEGQKQRVLMARALASHPDVLVLDEPTSAMDPMAEAEIFSLIETLRDALGLTVIVASHSMAVLPSIATHVVFLDRDDQIAVAGTREAVLDDPRFRARYGEVLASGDPT